MIYDLRLTPSRLTPRASRLLLLALMLGSWTLDLLTVPANAATVSGIIRDRQGNLTATNVNFRSIQRPIFTTPWIQPGWDVFTNSAANGVFTISLTPGDYGVSLGSDRRDAFIISVPNNSSNYTLGDVITSKLTYTFPYSPAFEMTINKNAPSGYAGLDSIWGRIPSWILSTNAPATGYGLFTDGTWNYWAPAGGGGGGEANTASNVGTGAGIVKQKAGVNIELRTFIGTNGVVASTNADHILFDGLTLSNALAGLELTRNAAVSNALAALLVANDTTTSNSLYSTETTRNAAVSNAIISLLVASDTTTSNGVVAFELTRNAAVSNALVTFSMQVSNDLAAVELTRNAAVSNALAALLVANDTSTSNSLYSTETTRNAAVSNALVTLLVANEIITSNGVVALELTRNAAVSNALAALLVANDTTTSNALRPDIDGLLSRALTNGDNRVITLNSNLSVEGRQTNRSAVYLKGNLLATTTNGAAHTIQQISYGDNPQFFQQRSGGSETLESPVLAGEMIGNFQMAGYGSIFYRPALDIQAIAMSDFSTASAETLVDVILGRNATGAGKRTWTWTPYNSTNDANLTIKSNIWTEGGIIFPQANIRIGTNGTGADGLSIGEPGALTPFLDIVGGDFHYWNENFYHLPQWNLNANWVNMVFGANQTHNTNMVEFYNASGSNHEGENAAFNEHAALIIGALLDPNAGPGDVSVTNNYRLAGKILHRDWASINWGSGSPEGVITARIGSMFFCTNGCSSSGAYIKTNGTGNTGWWLVGGSIGTGDVVGPASAVDNAIARFDTTTGKLIQNSGVIISDTTNVTGIQDLTVNRDATVGRNATIAGIFTANGLSGFNQLLSANQGITAANGIAVDTLQVTAGSLLQGGLTVAGTSLFYNALDPTSTNLIHLLTTDATPAGGDYVMTEDLSAGLLKKVTVSSLIGSGEANVNGEKAVTNATRFGWVWGKEGISNLLRSVEPRFGLTATNQGTNLQFAVDHAVIAPQTDLVAASNTLYSTETTRNAAVSNSVINVLVANDTTTSNSLLAQINVKLNTNAGTAHNLALRGAALPALTANRAAGISAAGDLTNSTSVDLTELGYLDGVTSGIQSQIAGKQDFDSNLQELADNVTTGFIAKTAGAHVGRAINGTSQEITVTDGLGASGNPVIGLPATIDLGGKTSLEIPNASNPTTDLFGEIAGDNNAWAAGRGTLQWYDGTATVFAVGVVASDAPALGQIPVYQGNGTFNFETPAGGTGGSNYSAFASGSIMISNVVQIGITNAGTDTNLVADWNGPRHFRAQLTNHTTISFTNIPAAGSPGRSFTLEILHVGGPSNLTIQSIGPVGINWQDGAPALVQNFTNLFDVVFTGTNFIGSSRQAIITGIGSLVASNQPVIVSPTLVATNTVTGNFGYVTALLSGTGGANTNYILFADQADRYINGFTNVSLRAVYNTTPGLIFTWSVMVTNISGTTRTLEFSDVTNRWRFQGTYGTNAPNTLTNNTALLIDGRSDGTNTQVRYTYFTAPL